MMFWLHKHPCRYGPRFHQSAEQPEVEIMRGGVGGYAHCCLGGWTGAGGGGVGGS